MPQASRPATTRVRIRRKNPLRLARDGTFTELMSKSMAFAVPLLLGRLRREKGKGPRPVVMLET